MTVTIAPELPAHVRFVVHDLVGQRLAPPDAVLASFDLALLRNVLIYFEPRLQQKALERLAAVLEPDGVAVLGPCERVPAALDRWFRPYQGLDPMLRIYKIRSP
jgi:chemotaxis methyl-accepting protein methylase